VTQPQDPPPSEPPPAPAEDEAQQEDTATEEALLAAFAAAVVAWLAAATAAILAAPGVPDLSLLPGSESYIRDATRRAEQALRESWRGTAFEATIPAYLRGLVYRLDGLEKTAVKKASKAMADAQAAHADVDAMRRAIRASLEPAEYDAYAERLAATEASIAVNTARQREAQLAAQAGATVTKTWRTRRDNRVRATHRAAEGQTRGVDQPFLVGGWPMMHPGDPDAPASEVVNCRCIATYHFTGGRR
jgi:hypothetical protein